MAQRRDVGGRPTKYDPERARQIAEYVRYGATIELAARSAGVSPRSVHRWMDQKPGFCQDIERAQADPICQNLRVMNLAAQRGSVAAAIWLLEHLAPEQYGKAATELPVVLSLLLQKLPPPIAGQVAAAWGIAGAVAGDGGPGAGGGALSSGGTGSERDEPGP